MYDDIRLPSGCMGLPLRDVIPPCIAGIDTRFGSWDIIIADLLTSQNLHHTSKVVRPVFAGKVRDEHQCLFLMRQYDVRFAVIDCRPEATLAVRLQEMADKYGIELWRAEYKTSPDSVEVTENKSERLLRLDRTGTLDRVYHAFQTGQGVTLPQNFREITDGSFVSEMTSSTRVPFRWHGRDAYTWEKHGDDHTFHAMNLLLLAFRRSGFSSLVAGAGIERGIVEGTIEDNLAEEDVYQVYLEV